VRESFILSRDAVALANKAFFDPSMMGLLYFVSTSPVWKRARKER
jgi:hypothetical protein